MTPELIERLKKLAEQTCWLDDDDFSSIEYSGGNCDDAFRGGQRAGEIQLARTLLTASGIPFAHPVTGKKTA